MSATTDRIRTKISRANQLIEDFQFRAATFYETHPYVVGTKEKSDTGQRLYYLAEVGQIPDALASIAADALQNLRSPLDYLATQIETAACKAKPKHRVYFPIGRDAAHYPTVRRAYIKCAGQAAIDAFDATEPYKGGKGNALWQLHELNKPDKHSAPLAVAGGYRSLDMGPIIRDLWRESFPESKAELPSLFMHPADRMCPLKVGDVLYGEPLDTPVHEERQFRVEVAFHEPGVIECESVLETLHGLSDLIGGIVTAFEPLLP